MNEKQFNWIAVISLVTLITGFGIINITSDHFEVLTNEGDVVAKYKEGMLKAYDGRYKIFENYVTPMCYYEGGYHLVYKDRGNKYSNLSYSQEGNDTYISQTVYYSRGNLTNYFKINKYGIKSAYKWEPEDENDRCKLRINYKDLDQTFNESLIYSKSQGIDITEFDIGHDTTLRITPDKEKISYIQAYNNGNAYIHTLPHTGTFEYDPYIYFYESEDYITHVKTEAGPTSAYSEYRLCNPTGTQIDIPTDTQLGKSFVEEKGELVYSWFEVKDEIRYNDTVNTYENYTELVECNFTNCTEDYYVNKTRINGTEEIERIRYEWVDYYNDNQTLDSGECIDFKIRGTYELEDGEVRIDNIPSFNGINFTEYAWWTYTTSTSAEDNLVVYYNFSSITDLSGNGNTGTNNGATAVLEFPTYNISGDSSPDSFDFDGSNDYVNTNYNFGDDFDNGFTWSLWVNPDATGVEEYYINAKGDDKEEQFSFFQRASDEFNFKINGVSCMSGSISVGTWYHLVGTYDGTDTIKIYIDGNLSNTCTGVGAGLDTPQTTLYIGRRSDGNAPTYFNGQLDEVKLFNRTINQTEINNLYNYGTTATQVQTNYTYRRNIANETSVATAINGTNGINGYNVWTRQSSTEDLYIAYDNYADTPMTNFTVYDINTNETVPYITEEFGTGYQTCSAFDTNAQLVYQFGDISEDSYTVNGATGATGIVGDAFDIEYSTDYIALPSSTDFAIDSNKNYTLSTWVKLESFTNNLFLYSVDTPSGAINFAFINDGSIYVEWQGGCTTRPTSRTAASTVTTGTWYQVTWVYDGSIGRWQIYLDGSLLNTGTYQIYQGTNDCTNVVGTETKWIGRRSTSDDHYDGLVDEFQWYNTSLTSTQISDLYANGSPDGSEVNTSDPNLVFYSSMQSGADVSCNDNHATVNGATWTSSGKYGGAYDFDDSNDYISLPAGNQFDIDGDRTLSVWVNPDTAATHDVIYFVGGYQSGGRWKFWNLQLTDSNNLLGEMEGDGGSSRSKCKTNEVLTNNVWTHVIMTWNHTSKACKIYINGTEATYSDLNSNMNGIVQGNTFVYIGGSKRTSFEHPYDGELDEVKLYNTILTASQIEQLYNNSQNLNMRLGVEEGDVVTGISVNVTLVSPENGTIQGSGVNFTYKPIWSGESLNNCSLYGNFSGTWELNQTNTSNVVNNTNNQFNEITFNTGNYIWNVECCTASVCNFSASNYSLTVDATPPNIVQINASGSINLTSGGLNQVCGYNGTSYIGCGPTFDGTPNIEFTTDENANCRFSTIQDEYNNYTNLNNCSTTGGTSQVCELNETITTYEVNTTLYLSCQDPYGNDNYYPLDNYFKFDVEVLNPDTPPTVTLNSPADLTTIFYPYTQTFNCSADDNNLLENVSLLIDGIINETIVLGAVNDTTQTFSKTFTRGTYTWNCQACDNASQCTNGTARTLYVNNTLPACSGLSTERNISDFCQSTDINVTCTDLDGDSITVNFNENSTGTFTNRTTTNPGGDVYQYTIDSAFTSPKNFSYKFIVNDSYGDVNSSFALQTHEIEKNTSEITLLLNGLSQDRKYELSYGANLTGIFYGCTNETVYLSLPDDPDYGINYTSDVDSNVYLNYIKSEIEITRFNDSTTNKNFTLTTPQIGYIELARNITLSDAKMKVEGFNGTAEYPKNVRVDINSDGVTDIYLPGTLIGNDLKITELSDGSTDYNISYRRAGTQTVYFNYSMNQDAQDNINVISENMTFDLTGFDIDPDHLEYEEFFDNESQTYYNNTCQGPMYIWDDFSQGDITGRWGGDYNVVTDSYIWYNENNPPDCSYTVTGSCQDQCVTTSNSEFYSQTLDLQDSNSVELDIQITAEIEIRDGSCEGRLYAKSGAGAGIRDTTSGVNYKLMGLPFWTRGTQTVRRDVEIKENNGYLEWYENGVYQDRISYDPDHDYEVFLQMTSKRTKGTYGNIVATAQGYIYNINKSGMVGAGGFYNYSDCFIISDELGSFTQNISRAIFDASYTPSGGTVDLYLSNDNGTTWESVLDNVSHSFSTEGKILRYRLNITAGTESTTTPVVDYAKVYVVPGFTSNIEIDVGGEGISEYSFNGTLNSTNSPLKISIDPIDYLEFLINNYKGNLSGIVPIQIKVDSPGIIEMSNINITQNISNIYLNTTLVEKGIENKSTFNLTYSATNSDGILEANNLIFQYKTDKNYTARVNFYGNENYTAVQDNQTVIWRYSPISVDFQPSDIDSYDVYPTSVNSKNVEPFGQVTKSTAAESTPIFNITTTAKKDPIKVYFNFDPAVNACLSMNACSVYDKSNCITGNTTAQLLHQNLNSSSSASEFHYWNLTSCDPTNLFLPANYTHTAYCQDCVVN